MLNISYILVGFLSGIFSGFLGLGGGLVLIPILVYVYGLSQHQAQGTSLAVMVPPITILAALRYYYSGNVKLNMAVFIALGFILGAFLGADFVQHVTGVALKKIFGVILLLVSFRMIFFN
ncbi:MAG: sulfite exporter TauE/SafE family protein [Candidatus Omnitrophica bacterium]|nr:sulfite exporter TauE/SafE family protein [Candidatus Omnitrophota bacterium]MBI5143542.1 sulfite exporter TauE/SafE family protein [Candidatus Omnitrophota bacterium]